MNSSHTTLKLTVADRLRLWLHYLLPQRLLSRCTYYVTRSRVVWFKNLLIRIFTRHFKVDMDDALISDVSAYANFNTFFTRALKPEVRPIASGTDELCCPVDGTVSQAAHINNATLLQAKGHEFSLIELLGGDPQLAALFTNGSFATLYLSPRDYHRIHMPINGQLREMIHIPGKLFSVAPLTTQAIPKLFARNERVVTLFNTAVGPLALILVGAINVSSIETVWAGSITPPLGDQLRRWQYPQDGEDSLTLAKGAEMGRFNMGSTVIILFAANAVQWASSIQANAGVRMGQLLARQHNQS